MIKLSDGKCVRIGDTCEIFVASKQAWVYAIIDDIRNTPYGTQVITSMKNNKNKRILVKKYFVDSPNVRFIGNSQNSVKDNEIKYCICKSKMKLIKNEYYVEYCYNIENEKFILCCNCACKIYYDTYCYICPKKFRKNCEIHLENYFICLECANGNIGDQGYHYPISKYQAKMKNNEVFISSIKHFNNDRKSSKYCYFGFYNTKDKCNIPCVIKKFKRKVYYNHYLWKSDIKCFDLIGEMIRDWNDVNKDKRSKVIQVNREKITFHEHSNIDDLLYYKLNIKENDMISIERYLYGNFVKFNSNSGWINEDIKDSDDNKYIQAFCHFTYDKSDGNYIVCDIDGIIYDNKIVINMPCILSKTGDKYGTKDIGNNYLLNFFTNHKCNKYCDPKWLKPIPGKLKQINKIIPQQMQTKNTIYQERLFNKIKRNNNDNIDDSKLDVKHDDFEEYRQIKRNSYDPKHINNTSKYNIYGYYKFVDSTNGEYIKTIDGIYIYHYTWFNILYSYTNGILILTNKNNLILIDKFHQKIINKLDLNNTSIHCKMDDTYDDCFTIIIDNNTQYYIKTINVKPNKWIAKINDI